MLTTNKRTMKKGLLLLFFGTFITFASFGQDCYSKMEKAFEERGSNPVPDGMHDNVVLCFFEKSGEYCVSGKAKVERGFITGVFMEYEDGSTEPMKGTFYNTKKQPPTITNGITEMIINTDSESFKIVFIESIKPKKKKLKEVDFDPSDL